jgi:hypothetical protein
LFGVSKPRDCFVVPLGRVPAWIIRGLEERPEAIARS